MTREKESIFKTRHELPRTLKAFGWSWVVGVVIFGCLGFAFAIPDDFKSPDFWGLVSTAFSTGMVAGSIFGVIGSPVLILTSKRRHLGLTIASLVPTFALSMAFLLPCCDMFVYAIATSILPSFVLGPIAAFAVLPVFPTDTRWLCRVCQYNLCKTTSGTCSECGTPTGKRGDKGSWWANLKTRLRHSLPRKLAILTFIAGFISWFVFT